MLASACVEDAAPPPPSGDQLVLELGGNAPSLRAALRRSAPPRDKLPAVVDASAQPDRVDTAPASPPRDERSDPEQAAPPQTTPNPASQQPEQTPRLPNEHQAPSKAADKVPAKPAHKPAEKPPATKPISDKPANDKASGDKPADKGGKTVRLRRGQNLYRVALEQLGDGSRWREIAKLNGWSERDIANLAADTPIRLPAR